MGVLLLALKGCFISICPAADDEAFAIRKKR